MLIVFVNNHSQSYPASWIEAKWISFSAKIAHYFWWWHGLKHSEKKKQVTLLQHFSNFFFKMLQSKKKCFTLYAKAFDCVDHNKLWKILQEIGIPDHPTCLLRNLYVKKQQLEPDMEQQTGCKLGKEFVKAVYCHPVYLTYMQSTSCEMLGWLKHKLESRLLVEISITSDMQMIPPLWQKVKKN